MKIKQFYISVISIIAILLIIIILIQFNNFDNHKKTEIHIKTLVSQQNLLTDLSNQLHFTIIQHRDYLITGSRDSLKEHKLALNRLDTIIEKLNKNGQDIKKNNIILLKKYIEKKIFYFDKLILYKQNNSNKSLVHSLERRDYVTYQKFVHILKEIKNNTNKQRYSLKKRSDNHFKSNIRLVSATAFFIILLIITSSITISKLHHNLLENNLLLASSNDMKNELFSIISHDLRSPFNSILGFLYLLDDNTQTCKDTKCSEYLGYIKESSQSYFLLVPPPGDY